MSPQLASAHVTQFNSQNRPSAPTNQPSRHLLSLFLNSSRVTRADMSSAKAAMVKELVNSDIVVIFSKSYCPYCNLAKEVFDKLQKKYTAIELDKRDDADEIQAILGEMTGAKTVPRVFVKGECLGGGSDVKALYESGKLEKYFD